MNKFQYLRGREDVGLVGLWCFKKHDAVARSLVSIKDDTQASDIQVTRVK